MKAQNQASFTLGPTPTSPLELANVDATLASHGTWCPPNPILAVTDATGSPGHGPLDRLPPGRCRRRSRTP